MDRKRWQKVNSIVDEALELDREDRSDYVEKQCKGDQQLRYQVTELLDSIEQSDTENFLEGREAYPRYLAADFARKEAEAASSSLIGEKMGNYQILDLIGHGGMGSVYLAERADEAYDRQVALKVMRRGMDTPSNIARLKRERNILANLDHPNIARLLDGGITRQGLPFLIMEYVDGTPLHEYCNRYRLSLEERLELFKSICKAVQHAHANAIIHRDLKPSNILVTGGREIKVLDFGIAKLLEPEGADSQLFQTRTNARILTLGYASPEQLEKKPVSTASDIYTLGILLYELLSGTHPFDLENKDLTEIEEIIRYQSPDKPSVKFLSFPKEQQQIADQRGTTPSALAQILEGDLDAIVMKALRKEPGARYSSPEQMVEDLRRRSVNLPVIAREDTFQYNARKFIKRHKTRLIAATAVFLFVIGFFAFHTWRISKERNIAQLEAQRAEAVTEFLTNLIQSNYPENAQGDTITVRTFLDRGYQKIQRLEETPVAEAEIMKVMGSTYRKLGQMKKARELVSRSLELLKQQQVPPAEFARTYDIAGLIYRDLGQPQKATKHLRRAVQLYKEAGATETADFSNVLRDLAFVEKRLGEFKLSEQHATNAIAVDKRIHNTKTIDLAESYHVYASLLTKQDKFSRALDYYTKAMKILQRKVDGPHPGKAVIFNNIAIVYKNMGQTQEAIQYYRKALAMNEELYGKNHHSVINPADNLARLYLETGHIDSAQYYNRFSLKIAENTLALNHPIRLRAYLNEAKILNRKGAYRQSDSLYKKMITILHNTEADRAPLGGNVYMNWAANAVDQLHLSAAERYYRHAFKLRKKNFGLEDSLTQISLKKALDIARKVDDQATTDSLSRFLL